MMFNNTYPPHFYRDLQRYVHKAYKKQKSVLNLKKLLNNPLSLDKSQWRSALLSMYYVPSEAISRKNLIDTK